MIITIFWHVMLFLFILINIYYLLVVNGWNFIQFIGGLYDGILEFENWVFGQKIEKKNNVPFFVER